MILVYIFINHFYKVLQFTRGGGYIWKPYFIKKALQDLKDGDILVYCDTGCHFNKLGKERVNQYLDLLNQSDTGILAFQLDQKEYTKREVFNHFESSPAVIESDQLMAAIILLKKCDYAVQLIDLWNRTVKEH